MSEPRSTRHEYKQTRRLQVDGEISVSAKLCHFRSLPHQDTHGTHGILRVHLFTASGTALGTKVWSSKDRWLQLPPTPANPVTCAMPCRYAIEPTSVIKSVA